MDPDGGSADGQWPGRHMGHSTQGTWKPPGQCLGSEAAFERKMARASMHSGLPLGKLLSGIEFPACSLCSMPSVQQFAIYCGVRDSTVTSQRWHANTEPSVFCFKSISGVLKFPVPKMNSSLNFSTDKFYDSLHKSHKF